MKISRKESKLYLLYIMAFLLCFEIVTSYVIMKIESNALSLEKYNTMSTLTKNYNRIILGDSRSHQGVNPKILDKNSSYITYNLAAPGMQTPFMYYIAKRFIKEQHVPKQIVVNMSFYLLGGQQWMKDIYFKHYVPTVEETLDSYSNNLNYYFKDAIIWYAKTHIPSVKHEGRISKALSNFDQIPKMYKESYKARQILFNENNQGYMTRGEHHIGDKIKLAEWNTKFHLGYSTYLNYMRLFFNLSNTYDTNIYIYEFPWPKAYRNSKNHKKVHEFYTNMIKEIASEYPNVYYIENNNLFLEHKYFVDPLHVNNSGAELLSKQLANTLNKRP